MERWLGCSSIHKSIKEPDKLECLFVRSCPDDEVYRERLKEELGLIYQYGFEGIFIKVSQIIGLLNDVPHIIRGSAAGSLVCYLLGLSCFDPVRYKCEFSRFLNPKRIGLPDVDCDVPRHMREEILKRIADHWPGKVARVSNRVMYREKSAIRETIRQMGFRQRLVRNCDPKSIFGAQIVPEVMSRAKELEGKFHHYSLHCGGIVVFEKQVNPALVLKDDQLKMNKTDLEKEKIVKIDILANSGLSQLMNRQPLASYPEEDESVRAMLECADTIGITFLESPAMLKILKIARPRDREELAFALAMVRPAPDKKAIRTALRSKRVREGRLQDPWRMMVYDDDVIAWIRHLLNVDAAEAERIRKGFAKGDKLIQKEMRDALIGKRLGEQTNDIMEGLGRLNSYSFCKAHAVSYAFICWALAWEKCHDKALFWLRALNYAQTSYRPWVHPREAICDGLRVLPSLKKSEWKLKGKTLYKESQTRLFPILPVHELEQFGYWTSAEFFPGCGLKMTSDNRAQVIGLIAWWRTVDNITLVNTGYANKRWICIIVPGNHDLSERVFIRAWGVYKELETLNALEMKAW